VTSRLSAAIHRLTFTNAPLDAGNVNSKPRRA
jgi:hypothetical protein